MKIMKFGSRGPQVQFLQLALNRAGYGPLVTDGIFGYRTRSSVQAFQAGMGLGADGIVGPRTDRALMPWYTGFTRHTLRRGDSFYSIARMHHTTVRRIETANPGLDPYNLPVGGTVIVPLSFPVVPTGIAWTSEVVARTVIGLAARYPFLEVDTIGRSVIGTPIPALSLGTGQNRVLYNAAHHANEWITTPVLMKFTEELAAAYANDGTVWQYAAREVLAGTRFFIVPAVDPDGIDLVTGYLTDGRFYDSARAIAADYPDIPFPAGWKANILGTDLNLQYPAEWEQAREVKFSQGFVSPAPRDFVGTAPLSAPEARAMYDFTLSVNPALILAYHTQGEVIYWKFLDYEPENSRAIAYRFSAASGYLVEETPYGSGFAGYKDWFIQNYDRPGYTIEAGKGTNPLPLSQFERIYADNLPILVLGAVLTAGT